MKCYQFNLDLPQSERWVDILNDHLDQFPRISKEIDQLLNNIGYNSIYAMIVNAGIYSCKNSMMYYDELVSISDITKISIDKLLIMQLIYELSSACTTVITEDKIMYRTMDWPMLFLKELTIELEIIKNGKLLCKATTWVGYVGLFTAMNYYYNYCLAINYRRTQDISLMSFISNAISALGMKWPIGYFVREVFCDNISYHDAKERLKTGTLISPTYISLCSSEECCVLTRDAGSLYNERTTLPLIQTNVDFDKTIPNILYSNERRAICQKVLTNDNIAKGLSIFPIINEETIYCNVIDPTQGTYYTTIKNFT